MHELATEARPETEAVRCPKCGGLNRAGAQWCGQCLERFAPPSSLEAPAPPGGDADAGGSRGGMTEGGSNPPPSPPGLEAPGSTVSSSAFTVGDAGITWSCKECDTVNPFDESMCSVCGMPFGDLLREPQAERPARDPNTVALISLLFPGAGHGYMGMWGQAVARATISAWVFAVTIVAGVQGGIGLMPLLFGAIAFCLWVVAAHDSYREATGASRLVILKQGYFLWVVLGILGLMMGMFVMQALQANAAAV